jgi:hypothetical protein
MADEVQIILKGSSAALQAELDKVAASLKKVDAAAQKTNQTVASGGKRTSKSINNQNKSFTLMVAKLALVAFAAKTVANIFQSTFGAVIKNIDDFNTAAISTAAAVTNLAEPDGRPIGEVFNQNLEATKQIFEELEIAAANFFSTGAELQLAFNTLAQKGVQIRREEFGLLGKLTDQIKLLTGGQNSQIQIQQELRSLLDGTARTTSAFAKQLQSAGVDIKELGREIRATQSLKPLEDSLRGLDAAGGAIKRTFSSVLATFQTLSSIVLRGVFADAFDGVVATVKRINDFLIDNRQEVIAIGRFINSKIIVAWKAVINVMDEIGGIFSRWIQKDLVQIIAAVLILRNLLKRGPLGILIAITGALVGITGEIKTANNFVRLLINSFGILERIVDFILVELGRLGEFVKTIIGQGFSFAIDVKGLQDAERLLDSNVKLMRLAEQKIERLSAIRNRSNDDEAELNRLMGARGVFQQRIVAGAQKVADLTNEMAKTEEGRTFLREREESIFSDLQGGLANIIKTMADLTEDTNEALNPRGSGLKDELQEILDKLREASKGFKDLDEERKNLSKPKDRFVQDRRLAEAVTAEFLRGQSVENKAATVAATAKTNVELAELGKIKAKRLQDAQEVFNRELELRQKLSQFQIAQLEEQKRLAQNQLGVTLSNIETNFQLEEGETKITEAQRDLQTLSANVKFNKEIEKIDQQINALRSKRTVDDSKADQTRIQNAREVQRLLEDRTLANQTFGRGGTNEENAAQARLAEQRSIADFAAQNPAADAADKALFAAQARLEKLNNLIATQLNAFLSAIDKAFDALIDAVFTGSFDFKALAENIGKDLIKAGLEDLIEQTKKAVTKGLQKMFSGFSDTAAQQSAQALAVGIGLLLAVLSRAGNDGDFTASGGSGGAGSISSSAQTRGLIGGDTSLPIAEINTGLQEALIPTNNILTTIERNTRPLAALSLEGGTLDLQQILSGQLSQLFDQAVLQNA